MPITNSNRYTAPDWTAQKVNATEMNAIGDTVKATTVPVGQVILSRSDPGPQYLPCDGRAADLVAYPELASVNLIDIANPTGTWTAGTAPSNSSVHSINSLTYYKGCWLCVDNYFASSATVKLVRYYVYYATSLSGPWTQAFYRKAENNDTGTAYDLQSTGAICANGYWVVVGHGYNDTNPTYWRGKWSYSAANSSTGLPSTWTHGSWGQQTSSWVSYKFYITGVDYDVSRSLWQFSGYRYHPTSDGLQTIENYRPYILTSSTAAPESLTATMMSSSDIITGGIKYYNGKSIMVGNYVDTSIVESGRSTKVGVCFVALLDGSSYAKYKLSSGNHQAQWDMVECYNGTWVIAPSYVPAGNSAGIYVSRDLDLGWTYIASPFTSSTTVSYWHSLKCIDGWWMIGDNSGNIYTTQDPTGLWTKQTILTTAQINNKNTVTAIGGYEHTGNADGAIVVGGSKPQYGNTTGTSNPSIYSTADNSVALPNIRTMFGVSIPPDTGVYLKAVSDEAYTSLTWRNNQSPYISATNFGGLTKAADNRQSKAGNIKLFVNQAPMTQSGDWVAVQPVPPETLGVRFCVLPENREVE